MRMDTILNNAKVFGNPTADAVLLRDGVIFHVGSFDDCKHYAKPGALFINIDGKNLQIGRASCRERV